MTIEEKAKAYDEALDRCKEWASGTWGHSVDDSPKDIAEFIFPQLAESEDERMFEGFMHKLEVCDLLTNKEIAWAKHRLKSLGPQSHWKPREEQPEVDIKKEIKDWCKENVKGVNPIYTADSLICALLPKCAHHFYELGKLNTRKGDNHWKPSEEQMKHLKRCFSHGKPHLPMPNQHVLESLYNDLEKRM